MKDLILEPIELIRNDGKVVSATYYNNSDVSNIEILDIKNLKFEGIKTKYINKSQIHDAVLKGENKIYL